MIVFYAYVSNVWQGRGDIWWEVTDTWLGHVNEARETVQTSSEKMKGRVGGTPRCPAFPKCKVWCLRQMHVLITFVVSAA
jgi:hypothetical protein